MNTKMTVIAVLVSVLLVGKTQTKADQVPENMVWIPPGTFMMGSPSAEPNRDSDETEHQVTISHGFYISKYEITQERYAAETGNNPSSFQENPNLPVERTTWYDAISYCVKLTERERSAGRLPAGYIYRLPTEAEWEYACRAGTTTAIAFGFGDGLSSRQANFNGSFPYNNGNIGPNLRKTALVGSYLPNAWGLYDMHGNIMEWCLDWKGPYPTGSITDPQGPISGFGRIQRGGSWDKSGRSCRSAARYSNPPTALSGEAGFRPILAWDFSNWANDVFGNLPVPTRPTYGDCPVKEPDKENLVVITHGWRPDMTWVEAMTNIIIKYVAGQNLNNWQVHAHKWLEKASQGGPKTALNNGKEEGVNLGKQIAGQGFGHVHLIAHSAGAGLIQSASETIKSLRSDIVVHLTFLDAFVGFNYEERGNYGKGADWSDSYFSRDFETSSGIYPFTEGVLDYAYNVDVTWLDTHLEEIQVSSSTSSGEVSQTCYQKVTSHSWPYQFYTNTVPPNTMIGSEGFGFPLSKEGGNWNFATNQYKVGKNALRVLGSSELSCVPNPSANSFHIELSLDFSKLPGASVIINSPGNVIIHGIDFTLKTASPAWMVAFIPITNKVNFVSLEAEFTSANGAEGLLSVYWETNVIGSVDERVVLPEVRQYTFPLPETATNSTRTLGFRLDAFSAIQSSVTVTNVALGFSGVREPFLLSFTGASKNGLPVLQLTGPAGFNYQVESSTNLVDWSTVAILVNTNGTVQFVDPNINNATAKFYRAVAP